MKYKYRLKDLNLRQIYKKNEIIFKIFKVIYLYKNNNLLNLIIQKRINKKLFIKATSKTSIRNYCIISGRSRSVYNKLKVSRIILREFGNIGLFFGLKKNSW